MGITRVGPPGCCHFTPGWVAMVETDLTGPANPSFSASVEGCCWADAAEAMTKRGSERANRNGRMRASPCRDYGWDTRCRRRSGLFVLDFGVFFRDAGMNFVHGPGSASAKR